MPMNRKHLAVAAAALALGLSGTALTVGSGKAHSDDASCEILAARHGGMITLEGVVHAKKPVSGTYAFRVASVGGAGSSNISQGGDFTAHPGAPARLGQVSLGSSGAVYEATLEVTTPAGRFTCRERAGT